MRNLHLMPMNSTFDDDTVIELNRNFPDVENLFVHAVQRVALKGILNSIVDADAFTASYINRRCKDFDRIFLHSLFLSPQEILQLSDEAASKIIWCVWGHDLYIVKKRYMPTAQQFLRDTIHFVKKILRGTYLRTYLANRKVAQKVASFAGIAIGYYYDEKMIRKRFGHKVPVIYGPYFSKSTEEHICRLRNMHLQKRDSTINIIIGHSGFPFLEHEKYLEALSKYKNEDIHINLVLSYGADEARIVKLRELAYSIFGEEKCTILTKMMSKIEYYEFLTKMDIAIFPFKHQSALGNVKRMAFMGVKMYFDPRGVLAKGFHEGGVKTYDCREVGKVSFSRLCAQESVADIDAPLFDTFNYHKNVEAWRKIL